MAHLRPSSQPVVPLESVPLQHTPQLPLLSSPKPPENPTPDDEYEEESCYALLELEHDAETRDFLSGAQSCQLLGMDTEHPLLRIEGKLFQGTHDFAMGTYLFFKEDENPTTHQVECHYMDKTAKSVIFRKATVVPRGGQSTPAAPPPAQEVPGALKPPVPVPGALKPTPDGNKPFGPEQRSGCGGNGSHFVSRQGGYNPVHALEGYYDNTIFHRIVRNFMIQGGDPTGTGTGGESIYDGKPFPIELHSRIRFSQRGRLAMATSNTEEGESISHSNQSQFFLTLDKCEWLDKKHTIFGKVVGDTIFNVLNMGTLETDAADRPLFPPRLLSVEVLNNPFPDIVVTRRTPQATAAAVAAAEKSTRPQAAARAVRNKALLSFGEEIEEDFGEEKEALKKPKKPLLSAHDAIADDPRLRGAAPQGMEPEPDEDEADAARPQQAEPAPAPTLPVRFISPFAGVAVQTRLVMKTAEERAEEARREAEQRALEEQERVRRDGWGSVRTKNDFQITQSKGHFKLGLGGRGASPSMWEAGGESSEDHDLEDDSDASRPEDAVDGAAEEYSTAGRGLKSMKAQTRRLKREILRMKEVGKGGGAEAGAGEQGALLRAAELAVDPTMDAHEQERQRYRARRRLLGHREADTLAKLRQFQERLRAAVRDCPCLACAVSCLLVCLWAKLRQFQERLCAAPKPTDSQPASAADKKEKDESGQFLASHLLLISGDQIPLQNHCAVFDEPVSESSFLLGVSAVPAPATAAAAAATAPIRRFLSAEDPDDEDVHDMSWMTHQLRFKKETNDLMQAQDDSLMTIDTRLNPQGLTFNPSAPMMPIDKKGRPRDEKWKHNDESASISAVRAGVDKEVSSLVASLLQEEGLAAPSAAPAGAARGVSATAAPAAATATREREEGESRMQIEGAAPQPSPRDDTHKSVADWRRRAADGRPEWRPADGRAEGWSPPAEPSDRTSRDPMGSAGQKHARREYPSRPGGAGADQQQYRQREEDSRRHHDSDRHHHHHDDSPRGDDDRHRHHHSHHRHSGHSHSHEAVREGNPTRSR
ncbi:putative Peptidyl-prolyl cis-trans isomerase CYP57 [Paratrimastix pyriformis]|uniref:Peptidyl-prolyl cis-trans isomerase CYP57 n=1 Tax=Paratrimastix pyriformis TaxID=342808 RepID=A0ABQ8UCT5_9EUKA|nr:putative Peptidyl-prolyl cis-trans isomerase CYP57 [Paratrimastix pyriformis]